MLILIVVLFLICWGPRLIMNVLVKSGLSIYSNWTYNTRIGCNLLSFVHSALNPFVYGFMSSRFRSLVFNVFHCRRSHHQRSHHHRNRNNNNNRNNINNKRSKSFERTGLECDDRGSRSKKVIFKC